MNTDRYVDKHKDRQIERSTDRQIKTYVLMSSYGTNQDVCICGHFAVYIYRLSEDLP